MLRFLQKNKRTEMPSAVAYRVSPAGRISLNPEGAVFLHVETGIVFKANRVGARIWQGVLEGHSPEAIVREVSRDFAAPPELVAQDTREFLSELQRAGFLTGSN
jgi:hypothetical protein